jgi:aspartate carbamoyltransferase catalytic subunit
MADLPPARADAAGPSGRGRAPGFSQPHLLGIADLNPYEILDLLDRAEAMIPVSHQERKSLPTLSGKTQINLFFEPSTRTQGSFEIAGKRLGAQVMNLSVRTSSVTKGETLIDTAATLNAMRPDVIVVRHSAAGAVQLLSQKVGCAVINAGDGAHEHPTQALLDALTIRRHKGRLSGLTVAICGDIANSRVARSNLLLLGALQIRTRVIAPKTLLPAGIEHLATEVFTDMREGLAGADVVMMLRLQHERAAGKMIPSVREYYRFYGLDADKLAAAKPDAIVMHPGPMNRGVEIDPAVADGERSVITDQVEMGVAVRMAVLEALLPDRNESAP